MKNTPQKTNSSSPSRSPRLLKLRTVRGLTSLFGFLFAVVAGFESTAAEQTVEFEPKTVSPITENWRWRSLEPFEGKVILTGCNGENGSLWFAGVDRVYFYDGGEPIEYHYPQELGPAFPLSMFAANDVLYVSTIQGLRTLKEGTFTEILPYEGLAFAKSNAFAQTKSGTILVGTPIGLYQIENEQIRPVEGANGFIMSVATDDNNQLWFAEHLTGKIYRCPITEDGIAPKSQWGHYQLSDDPNNRTVLHKTLQGEIWAMTKNRDPARRYIPESDSWAELDLTPINGSNQQFWMSDTADGSLLIQSGFSLAVRHKGNWDVLKAPEFPIPLTFQFAFRRGPDRIITGSETGPLIEIDASDDTWQSHYGLSFQCEDNNGKQWFISVDSEIVTFAPQTQQWAKHVGEVIDMPNAIFCSSDGTIWASGSHQRIAAVSYLANGKWTRETFPKFSRFISHEASLELENGNIVFGNGAFAELGQEQWEGGLIVFRKKAGSYSARHIPPQDDLRFLTRRIAEADSGKIVIGGRGLVEFDLSTNQQTNAQYLYPELPGRRNPTPSSIATNPARELWVAFWGHGLYQLQGDKQILHSRENGLLNNYISSLAHDSTRNTLWTATNSGISRYDGRSWTNRALPDSFSIEREAGTIKVSKQGDVWINNLPRNWFYRSTGDLSYDTSSRYDFITRRYTPNSTPPETRLVQHQERILKGSDSFVGWEGFDPFSITQQSDLEFSYRIDSDDWTPFQKQSNALIRNLNTGEHHIEVRARDIDGNIDPTPAVAIINVIPPIWQTPWFIASCVLVALLLITFGFTLVRQRIRHLIELEDYRVELFANITHELRNPLTVIFGHVDRLLGKTDDSSEQEDLKVVKRNAGKILRLVNQILDLRKSELGKHQEAWAHTDLVSFVHSEIEMNRPSANDKQQSLEFKGEAQSLEAWIDTSKLETVLDNLLVNAIKYTPDHGSIVVSLKSTETTKVELIVQDNGYGIPPHQQALIFEPFYRARNFSEKTPGSGLGLALTKTLIDAMHGTIEVSNADGDENTKRKGTRFVVTLPLQERPPKRAQVQAAPLPVQQQNDDKRDLILLVEDDSDIRNFISRELGEIFSVIEASDGAQGYEKAREHVPDVIVSDVLMPDTNGWDFCRLVRNDVTTSHIPFVFLTALESDHHELKGLQSGAQHFLNKPVRIPILKQYLSSILENRRLLQEKLQQKISNLDHTAPTEIEEKVEESATDRFIKQVVDLIEEISLVQKVVIEDLADSLNMSRMTLYRKIKALTGQTPTEFIKSIQMRKAATLLRTGKFNVTEVMHQVGWDDLSYFGSCFKKQYQKSPSQFLKDL
ncbi:hybrid sensor histidine kinase/response regulator transcription factor [Pelagicoccus mobilis]|uniref:histidine kinase n=1 Tax=Pelagicoccus mobilis TaxID=415221 RepID=A0A934RY67_9BACT|nr:hybrid sensor histidine kinase/response regulator transcription factor [Pelagicoccus mobilis]MBK1876039.1 response regulator [Pelagicoccus mobilis]